MEFKYIYTKQRVTGATKERYLVKNIKKEISKEQTLSLMKKGKWGSFKQYAYGYEKGKFYYGMKKFNTFNDLLKEIVKNSKKKILTIELCDEN